MTNTSSNRVKFGSTLREDLYNQLQSMSNETGIPITKLLDKAVELLINNHNK